MPTSDRPRTCVLGIPLNQLQDELSGEDFADLCDFLSGQTGGVCDGKRWDPEAHEYVPTGCGPHGATVYRHDYDRWRTRG